MPECEAERDPIPENFETLDDLWAFWDNHSLADYDDMLRRVDARVNITRCTHAVPVEPKLLRQVTELAHSRGVSCETLVNLWLRDGVDREAGQGPASGSGVPAEAVGAK